MKHLPTVYRKTILAACLALPAVASAQSNVQKALSSLTTVEAPRVTKVIDDQETSTLAQTHLAFMNTTAPLAKVDDQSRLTHMQLVLKRSDQRSAALAQLIEGQHDPKSPLFHHWLTPAEYGDMFGLSDSDLQAAKSWLIAQGFTVHGVYANKMQIDFSGTAKQVNQAFHTQENIYKLGKETHIANASDISVPTALQPIVTGVAGLNTLRPKPQHITPRTGYWNKATGKFQLAAAMATTSAGPRAQAVNLPPGGEVRGLVPDDLAAMYNVAGVRAQGVTGKGVTIAVVEDESMIPADWTNFVNQFNLEGYGGSFSQIQPQSGGMNNCLDPSMIYGAQDDGGETLLDAEWSTAIAPGAKIVVASCADYDPSYKKTTDNFFGGAFLAAANLVNSDKRPDIISVSYGYGKGFTDAASKTAIDQMWSQADAEGISVFVSSGDTGSNPSFNGGFLISGAGVDANSFATSPNVTAVGGTDTADVLDGTTAKYFRKTPTAAYATALSYVPEIPWNESCGNEVAAKAKGFASTLAFCKEQLKFDPFGRNLESESGSGGPSSVDRKPVWQRLVTGAAKDSSRDLPDVSLFAGSYNLTTLVVVCTSQVPCDASFSKGAELSGGTSLSAPMFAGIQALVDQTLAAKGQPLDQGNAAPVLYALAGMEYGTGFGSTPTSLDACSADKGTSGTANCVFHNITRGSIASNCFQELSDNVITPNCYFFGTVYPGDIQVGLTSLDPKKYNARTEAYAAHPGWSFASGLGSVNTANLLKSWGSFVGAQ